MEEAAFRIDNKHGVPLAVLKERLKSISYGFGTRYRIVDSQEELLVIRKKEKGSGLHKISLRWIDKDTYKLSFELYDFRNHNRLAAMMFIIFGAFVTYQIGKTFPVFFVSIPVIITIIHSFKANSYSRKWAHKEANFIKRKIEEPLDFSQM